VSGEGIGRYLLNLTWRRQFIALNEVIEFLVNCIYRVTFTNVFRITLASACMFSKAGLLQSVLSGPPLFKETNGSRTLPMSYASMSPWPFPGTFFTNL
jgi:hypothetical protein